MKTARTRGWNRRHPCWDGVIALPLLLAGMVWWSVVTGIVSSWSRATLRGHTDRIACVAFSPDGRTLASSSYDQTVRVWDLPTRQLRYTIRGYSTCVSAVAFSPDGHTLATASDVNEFARPDGSESIGRGDRKVKICDASSGRWRADLCGDYKVECLAFSPGGEYLATGGWDHRVAVWDLETLKPLWAIANEHDAEVRSVAFSPDGKRLVSGSFDGTAKVWDATTGKVLATLVHWDGVDALAFSSDGRTLATGSGVDRGGAYDPRPVVDFPGGDVKLWDVVTGCVRKRYTGHWRGVAALAFAPDGQTLATGDGCGTIRICGVPPGP